MQPDLGLAARDGTTEWIDRRLIVSGRDAPATLEPLVAAMRSGDRAALEELFADDVSIDDRRARTDTPMMSRDQLLAALASFGRNAFDVRLLAVRSGRYAMVRLMFERTEGGIADMVAIVAGGGAAVDAIQVHDTASFGNAVRVLSGAYVTSLPTHLQAVVGVSAATLGALIERRYEDLAVRLADDFAFRDYRQSLPHSLGRDESVALAEAIFDEAPGLYDYVPEILDLTPMGLAATYSQATVADLGASAVDVVVMGVLDGQLTSLNMFDGHNAERALQLLRSWG